MADTACTSKEEALQELGDIINMSGEYAEDEEQNITESCSEDCVDFGTGCHHCDPSFMRILILCEQYPELATTVFPRKKDEWYPLGETTVLDYLIKHWVPLETIKAFVETHKTALGGEDYPSNRFDPLLEALEYHSFDSGYIGYLCQSLDSSNRHLLGLDGGEPFFFRLIEEFGRTRDLSLIHI